MCAVESFISGREDSFSILCKQAFLAEHGKGNVYSRNMELKDWVRTARKSQGLTQEQLGERLGRTKANVGHWETGKHDPSYEQIRKISEITGYPMPGIAENPAAYISSLKLDNIEPGPDIKGRVPIISWVQAGPWSESCNVLDIGDVEHWLDCPVPHGRCTAALRVRGDSMTAPLGALRSYPEGSYIFVDFERRTPVNGQRIVAKLVGSGDATFKVYKDEDGRRWLLPLNPLHPPMFEQFEVLGTVIGMWVAE